MTILPLPLLQMNLTFNGKIMYVKYTWYMLSVGGIMLLKNRGIYIVHSVC